MAAKISVDGGAAGRVSGTDRHASAHLFAPLPAAIVRPTPFQRDLSPAHRKRLTEVMKKLDRYTEPIVPSVAPDGGL